MVANRRVLRPLAVVVLVAAVVMFGALFLPFVRQGCIFCPISGPGYTFQLPTFSLMQGLDGWIVLCVVVAMGLAAVAHLRDAMRISAIACLLLSLAALGLCVFEGVELSRPRRWVGRIAATNSVGCRAAGACNQPSRVLELRSLRLLQLSARRCPRVRSPRAVDATDQAAICRSDCVPDPGALASAGTLGGASFRGWKLPPHVPDRPTPPRHRCRR